MTQSIHMISLAFGTNIRADTIEQPTSDRSDLKIQQHCGMRDVIKKHLTVFKTYELQRLCHAIACIFVSSIIFTETSLSRRVPEFIWDADGRIRSPVVVEKK